MKIIPSEVVNSPVPTHLRTPTSSLTCMKSGRRLTYYIYIYMNDWTANVLQRLFISKLKETPNRDECYSIVVSLGLGWKLLHKVVSLTTNRWVIKIIYKKGNNWNLVVKKGACPCCYHIAAMSPPYSKFFQITFTIICVYHIISIGEWINGELNLRLNRGCMRIFQARIILFPLCDWWEIRSCRYLTDVEFI